MFYIEKNNEQITRYTNNEKVAKDLFSSYESVENEPATDEHTGKIYLTETEIPEYISTVQEQIYKYQTILAQTDWYVTRNLETGAKIPEDIKSKRQEARDKISELKLLPV